MDRDAKPAAITTATAQLDQDLARQAIEKRRRGEVPTVQEQRALKRLETEREEKLRWQYYAAIPQKHWREMSGRQAKILNEQAQLYGLPFGGAVINLPDVVRAIHDLLARKGRLLLKDEDEMLSGDNSPALERYREEKALLARFDRLEREGVLVRKDVVRDGTGRIAARLRNAAETLERQFGPGALEILLEALDDVERDIQHSYGGGSNGHADNQQPG